jgi:DNA-binding MarR family transcriptional regulator
MPDFVSEVITSWSRVRPELDTSSVAVVTRILRAAQLLQSRLDATLAASGELSHKGDLDTLTALRRADPDKGLSPTTLAHVGQLTSGGMTNRLDRLEAGGLVERRPDPADRRAVLVTLTSAGVDLVDAAFVRNLAEQEGLLTALSSSERRQVAAILEVLLISLGDIPLHGQATARGV